MGSNNLLTGAATVGGGAALGSTFGPVGTFVGAAAGGIASLWNAWQSHKTTQWQKEAQEKTWEREDNSRQRAVADMRAAGLSPTLAAGSPAQTGSPTKLEAPKIDAFAIMNMAKMKADISKTYAETRVLESQAKVAEATVPTRIGSEAQKLRIQDLTEKYLSGKISIQEYENTLQELRIQNFGAINVDWKEQSKNRTMTQNEILEKELMYMDIGKILGLSGNSAQIANQIADFIRKMGGRK